MHCRACTREQCRAASRATCAAAGQGSKPCNVCAMPWGGRPQDPAHVRRSCLHTPHIFPTTPSGMFCTHTLVLVAQQLCMLRSTAPVRGVQVAEGERPGGTCTASASRCDTAPLAQATGYCTGTAPCCSPGAPHPPTCGLLASAMAQGCATWHPGGGAYGPVIIIIMAIAQDTAHMH